MRARVTHHGFCSHESESWNLALAAALSCAGKTMNPRERQGFIRGLMRGEDMWHGGVHFKGELVR